MSNDNDATSWEAQNDKERDFVNRSRTLDEPIAVGKMLDHLFEAPDHHMLLSVALRIGDKLIETTALMHKAGDHGPTSPVSPVCIFATNEMLPLLVAGVCAQNLTEPPLEADDAMRLEAAQELLSRLSANPATKALIDKEIAGMIRDSKAQVDAAIDAITGAGKRVH